MHTLQRRSSEWGLLIFCIAFSAEALAGEGSPSQWMATEPQVASADVTQSIRRMLTEQQTSWNRSDIPGFMQHYWKSDQLTFSSGGKTTRGWQATLDGYEKRYSTPDKMGRLTFDKLEVFSLTEEAAYVLGRWRLDRDEPIQGNFSLILKKIEKEWRIVHDHTSVDATNEHG